MGKQRAHAESRGGRGHLDGPEWPGQPAGAALASEHPGVTRAPMDLEEERVALRPLDEKLPQGGQTGLIAE